MACRETTLRRGIEKALKAAGCRLLPIIPTAQNGLDEWPDCLVLGPRGVSVFVEFKAPGETPRPGQNKTLDALSALGYKVMVVDRPGKFAWLANALGLEPQESHNAA